MTGVQTCALPIWAKWRVLPRERRKKSLGVSIKLFAIVVHVWAGNDRPAIGESDGAKGTAEAPDWAVTIDKVVTVPDDHSSGAWRMNPEVKARIPSEERGEVGDERLKSAKLKLRALITPRITFTARCVQDVEDEEWRRETLNEFEQNGRVTAWGASNKP